MDDNNTIGQNINRYRKELSLTQSQLAEMINVTPQAISKWEKGGSPDASILPRIASALNVSIDDLFGIHDKPASGKDTIIEAVTSFIQNKDAKEQISSIIDLAFIALISTSDNPLMKELFSKIHDLDSYPLNNQMIKLQSEHGFAIGNIVPDNEFVFVSKPFRTDSLSGEISEYAVFFNVLSDPMTVSILNYFLTQKSNASLSPELLSSILLIDEKEVTSRLMRLERINILSHKEVITRDGEYISWYIRNNIATQALLTLAGVITNKNDKIFSINLDKTKDYSLLKD
ncbi:MAG: helix-turn-helix transcriptional regulator [Clostridia bacterium]|nr:helix-turn-helix transcriptional regulator [Clostridia bacterium]